MLDLFDTFVLGLWIEGPERKLQRYKAPAAMKPV